MDDDMLFLIAISRLLSKADFTVVTAVNGRIGLLKAQTEKPDLIVMDVNLPFLNGFEVKKALQENESTRNIPVVFLTALSDKYHFLDGIALAEEYINKTTPPENC